MKITVTSMTLFFKNKKTSLCRICTCAVAIHIFSSDCLKFTILESMFIIEWTYVHKKRVCSVFFPIHFNITFTGYFLVICYIYKTILYQNIIFFNVAWVSFCLLPSYSIVYVDNIMIVKLSCIVYVSAV